MKIPSFDKTFHLIIKEIAQNHGIGFRSIADNRVIELTRENKLRRIIGYNFDINDSGARMVAKYKDLTSSILEVYGIPNIEHKVFRNPMKFLDIEPNWLSLIKYAERFEYDVVCKPNSGALGMGVTRIMNQAHLEETVAKLFSQYSSIALSPYNDILHEIRFVVLEKDCILIFEKERPYLRGNGKDTIANLLNGFIPLFDNMNEFLEFFNRQNLSQRNMLLFNTVLQDGEILYLNWKHNAAKGLRRYTILSDSPLCNLAISSADLLRIKFGSIDIVETNDGPKVLEVNSGVDLKKLYQEHYDIVTNVYAKTIKKMFQME